jgi:hypothetical protein
VTFAPDDPDIEFVVDYVLQQTSDGNSISHKIHLYTSHSLVPGLQPFSDSSFSSLDIHLTPTHNKLLKRYRDKIKAILLPS